MSTIENNSDHLRSVAHPINNPYRLESSKDTNRVPATVTVVRSSRMGGMVSTLSAVLCGTSKQPSTEELFINPTSNGYNKHGNHNKDYSSHTSQVEITLDASKRRKHRETPPRRSDSYCENSDDSNSEYCDASTLLTPREDLRQFEAIQDLNLRYIDSDSDASVLSTSEQNLASNRILQCPKHKEEIIEVSETEYSADEEQEEQEEEIVQSDTEELEKIESEDDEPEERHVCDSDCEHSEEEIEDESEPASEEEEHTCHSECDHSDLEENTHQSEYDSEYDSEQESEANDSESEENLINGDQDVIEISENEASCDEEQQTESEDELVGECGSECPSDCEGDHHVCSSECGCDIEQSDSENGEGEQDNNDNHNTPHTNNPPKNCPFQSHSESLLINGTDNHKIPPPPSLYSFGSKLPLSKNFSLQTTTEILNPITAEHKLHLKPTERNNNRVQRNHSQRMPLRSNEDMMGELRSAINERVRRSASCRETATDYRKKYAHLSSNPEVSNNFSKLDLHEREARRKDRRSRLRTLELKREQCLDELRDGTEENVTERVYRDTTMIESG